MLVLICHIVLVDVALLSAMTAITGSQLSSIVVILFIVASLFLETGNQSESVSLTGFLILAVMWDALQFSATTILMLVTASVLMAVALIDSPASGWAIYCGRPPYSSQREL